MMRSFLVLYTALTLVSGATPVEQEARVDVGGDLLTNTADNPYDILASSNDVHWKALTAWVREQGGFVHDFLEARRDAEGAYGVFTKGDLQADETILVIPSNLTINSYRTDDICKTLENLQFELDRKNESSFAPYVNFLRETVPRNGIPATWSEAGLELLEDMVSGLELPPQHPAGWNELSTCDLEENDLFAAQLVRQRAFDDIMIPVYDMLKHGSVREVNTEIEEFQNTPFIRVRAKRAIESGQELYLSYTHYPGSESFRHYYGTPELFADKGIIEYFPQRWIFTFKHLAFQMDQVGEYIRISWIFAKPSSKAKTFLDDAIAALESFYSNNLEENSKKVPDSEWRAIQNYYEALLAALISALTALDDPNTCVMAKGDCPETYFDDLAEQPEPLERELYVYTCDAQKTHEFKGYVSLDQVESHYQFLEFDYHPKTNDIVFTLDGIIQQTTGFRPHYHEPFVHYTARYIDDVKRVMWIGGGDSMLLHDFLKYPNLELAVGLELDQKVTRYNFKHMGAQPHFDNEKVQWWYGDATKSLMMLPKEYFGSFDMVLIDLSDTAMDLSVTTDLNIFGALALLLRKGGVIVKNGLFLEQFSRVFDYTLQTHFYDVPLVCSQSFILGSYDLDFLKKDPVDHGITDDTLLIPKREDLQGRFDIWHDYRRNVGRTNAHCKKSEEAEPEPVEQLKSPGILMVIEAEDVRIDLGLVGDVIGRVVDSLKKVGLTVLSQAVPKVEDEEPRVFAIVLGEGYVVAHIFPESKYVAFDLHLWGSYEKHETAKKALVSAVGGGTTSKSTSSYRIVAGGMFGVATWKEDEKNRGPHYTHLCDDEAKVMAGVFSDQGAIDAITKELFSLVDLPKVRTVVICGKEDEPCATLDALRSVESIGTVSAFYACPGIGFSFEQAQLCEASMVSTLNQLAKEVPGEKVRAVVVDSDAPYAMGRILHRVVKKKRSFFAQDLLVIAHTKDAEKTWRRALLDRFRRDFLSKDPVFRAQVLFNNTESSLEMGVVSSGDSAFIGKLVDIVSKMEKELSLVAEVRNIQGANFTYQDDFDPEHVFQPNDFDMSDSLAQWNSQRAVALQTVFQLEMYSPAEYLQEGDQVTVYLSEDFVEEDEEGWEDGVVVDVDPKTGLVDVRVAELVLEDMERDWVRKDPRRATSVPEPISAAKVKEALASALKTTKFGGMETAEIREFDNVGDGNLQIAFWKGGSALVLWDGRNHVDINLLTYKESVDAANTFVGVFKETLPVLKTALRDEQPRGYGRVVTYASEIKASKGKAPVWAKKLLQAQTKE